VPNPDRFATLLVVAAAAIGTFPCRADDADFRAGFAKAEITPRRPLPMWGYAARHDRLSRGTRDPLFAKCLVIEARGARLAIVGLDLGRSLGEPNLSRIRDAARTRSAVEHVLMVGSHTHHGPVLELRDLPGQGKGKFDDAVAYVGELERTIAAVIDEAARNVRPARIGWTSRDVDLNRNRHSKREPKPRDTELSVIRVDDRDGKPIAAAVQFAAHPTMLEAADMRWSADYPGAMMRRVESELGAPCLFLQGAAGDMSSKPDAKDHVSDDDPRLQDAALDPALVADLRNELGVDESEATRAAREFVKAELRMEAFGTRLGDQVLELARSTESRVPEYPSLQGRIETMEFDSRVDFGNDAVRATYGAAFFPEIANAYAADYRDNIVRATLTTVLLNGELALVGGSGEFFSQHAVRLRQRAHAGKTVFLGYCNGHNMYFPTIEGAAQGGYGADALVSWVEVGGGERILDQALINIFTMRGSLVP